MEPSLRMHSFLDVHFLFRPFQCKTVVTTMSPTNTVLFFDTLMMSQIVSVRISIYFYMEVLGHP